MPEGGDNSLNFHWILSIKISTKGYICCSQEIIQLSIITYSCCATSWNINVKKQFEVWKRCASVAACPSVSVPQSQTRLIWRKTVTFWCVACRVNGGESNPPPPQVFFITGAAGESQSSPCGDPCWREPPCEHIYVTGYSWLAGEKCAPLKEGLVFIEPYLRCTAICKTSDSLECLQQVCCWGQNVMANGMILVVP